MRIKKTSQAVAQGYSVNGAYSESQSQAYSCEYINYLNTYTTTEQRIGTWINGKPLYSKTLETTAPVVSTDGTNVYKDVPIDESNIDYVFVDKAFLWATGVIYNVCGDVANMSGNLRIRLEANMTNKNIRVYSNNSGYSNSNLIIVVNYTKTTD